MDHVPILCKRQKNPKIFIEKFNKTPDMMNKCSNVLLDSCYFLLTYILVCLQKKRLN